MAKILNEDEDDLSSLSTLTPSEGSSSRSASPASVRSNQKVSDDYKSDNKLKVFGKIISKLLLVKKPSSIH